MNRILVIEDNMAIRENTEELLLLYNYQVITASNGAEGMQKISQSYPDIVLCDIMMPELNGIEVLKRTKQNTATAKIPFIFLSAAVSNEFLSSALPYRPDAWLEKPFTERSLISTIQHVLKAA
ncbi:MAG: response regulator [Chitinophagales bacterium]